RAAIGRGLRNRSSTVPARVGGDHISHILNRSRDCTYILDAARHFIRLGRRMKENLCTAHRQATRYFRVKDLLRGYGCDVAYRRANNGEDSLQTVNTEIFVPQIMRG